MILSEEYIIRDRQLQNDTLSVTVVLHKGGVRV